MSYFKPLPRYLFLLLLSIGILSSACSKDHLTIENAYIPIRSESQSHFAAYFKVTNNSNEDLVLQSVSSPQFASVMLHETRIEQGIAKMRHLDSPLLVTGSSLILEPNAKHLMLMQAKESIWSRTAIDVQLNFSDGTELLINIPLKKISH